MQAILNYKEFTSITTKHAEKAFYSFNINLFPVPFILLQICIFVTVRDISFVPCRHQKRKTLDISPELQSKFKKSVRGSGHVVKILDSQMLQKYVIFQKAKQNTSVLCSVWGCAAQAALCAGV